jgi:hypothetical protein
MDELLSNVFSLFGYEHIKIKPPEKNEKETDYNNRKLLEQFPSRLYSSGLIQDYWLVYTGSPSELMAEGRQAELLKACRLICDDDSLDKNLNLLCLWQNEKLSDEHFKVAHLAEEDMFFFKKYVLYFKELELEQLQNKISEIGVEEVFRKLPLKPEFFTQYKSLAPLLDDWSSLLYRICIKLTFITLNQDNVEQLTNLKGMIEKDIQDKGLLDFENFIEHIEGVENKEPDDWLVLLDKEIFASE